jgi:hypothetical protein
VDLPPNLLGNYHLAAGSPAINVGAASKSGRAAPTTDIDGDARSNNNANPNDAGADEYVAVAAAVASVTPTSRAFGNVIVGSTSAAQTLTLSNSGTATLNNISVAIGAPFSRTGGSCGTTLNAGASCTISVVFSPTAVGAATGSVAITASVAVSGAPAALSGTGVAAPGTVSFTSESGPASFLLNNSILSFGSVNSTTVNDTVTLTIGGGSPVTFGTATVADGAGQGTFSKGTDTCSGTTRAVGSTCTIQIILNMPGNGFTLSVGALTVPHNGAGSSATLALTGN